MVDEVVKNRDVESSDRGVENTIAINLRKTSILDEHITVRPLWGHYSLSTGPSLSHYIH